LTGKLTLNGWRSAFNGAAAVGLLVAATASFACGGSPKMTPSSGPPDERRTKTDHKEQRKRNTAPPPAYGHKVARDCASESAPCGVDSRKGAE
jgi:hypothetical protein